MPPRTTAGGATRQSSGAAAGQAGAGAAATTSETADILKDLFKRTNQDIGADEFVAAVLANAAGANILNSKLQVDNAMEECQATIKSAQGHLDELRTVRLQMLNNLAQNSQNTQAVVTDSLKLGSDRMWNLNETDQLATIVASVLGKLGPQQDAFIVALMSALADVVEKAKKSG